MAAEVTSVFVIDTWEEVTLDEREGSEIVRTTITKTFTGDLVGTSDGWMTMVRAQRGSMAYVGFERISATMGGRTGTFVLQHHATGNADGGGDGNASWHILAESGTGDLTGIRGSGQIIRDDDGTHTLTLLYDV